MTRAVERDPRYGIGAIYPLREAWIGGDRTLWCSIVKPDPTGTLDTPFTGELR